MLIARQIIKSKTKASHENHITQHLREFCRKKFKWIIHCISMNAITTLLEKGCSTWLHLGPMELLPQSWKSQQQASLRVCRRVIGQGNGSRCSVRAEVDATSIFSYVTNTQAANKKKRKKDVCKSLWVSTAESTPQWHIPYNKTPSIFLFLVTHVSSSHLSPRDKLHVVAAWRQQASIYR